MIKRLFCILLAVMLLLGVLPTATVSAKEEAGSDILFEGDTPHRVHWTLYKDYTLRLAPNDKYSRLDKDEHPWTAYAVDGEMVDGRQMIKTLVIENGLTYIPERMFIEYPELVDVTVNGDLEEIEVNAFRDCTSLRRVTIHGNVGRFEGNACWGGIRERAFCGCWNMWSFHVDGRIANIGENAFLNDNLDGILALICGDIGESAFRGNRSFCYLPPVRGSVCQGALTEASYMSGRPVFVVSSHHGDLSGLQAVKSEQEWDRDRLRIVTHYEDISPRVYFTGTEEEFKANFYDYERSIHAQHLGEDVTWALDEATGVLTISGSGSTIDLLDMVEQPWLNIPGRSWDENRERITKVRVPYGVQLGTHMLDQLEDRVEYYFDQSGTLGTVNWGISGGKLFVSGTGATPSLYGRENDAWMPYREEIREIIIQDGITGIGFGAFMQCPNLERVTFADSITEIAGGAFYGCSLLDNVVLPQNLKTLGRNAFTDCSWLQRIFIPAAVESIGSQCFDRAGLTDIYYGGTTEQWNALHVSGVSGAFVHMSSPGLPPSVSSTQPPDTVFFADVSAQAYYADAVRWAVREEITAGTDETHFSPEATCTRAQMVTFLWRTAGEPEPEYGENPFKDVAETAYYYRAVLWAAEAGITKGVDETRFAPEATVTRAQAATLLCRAFGGEEEDASLSEGGAEQSEAEDASLFEGGAEQSEAEDASLFEGGAEQSEAEGVTPFVDVPADAYFADAVRWAAKSGVTNGTDETHFSPDAPCLRCQIVTFLCRAVRNPEPAGDAS